MTDKDQVDHGMEIRNALSRTGESLDQLDWVIVVSGSTQFDWAARKPKDFGSVEFHNAWITMNGQTQELPEFAKQILREEFGDFDMKALLKAMEMNSG